MTNDNAITRLLYAILSQKCLKDIDWNKVAHDPILAQEITNGHAARMRYSRFKKQMDGTASVRRTRNPNSPRKTKVEKNKSPKKVKERRGSHAGEMIKQEAGSGHFGQNNEEGTPEIGMGNVGPGSLEHCPLVKTEPGISSSSTGSVSYGHTPFESQAPTPSPGFSDIGGSVVDMDEMMASFEMPLGAGSPDPGMYQPMLADGGLGHPHGYGMMGYPFEGMCHNDGTDNGMLVVDRLSSEGFYVKTEPR